jgi:dTDP-glucose 4,6-dehydratase
MPINLGNPDEISILEFAEIINRLVDNEAEVVFETSLRSEGDPQRRRPDISRARSILEWEPNISLEEGIRCTIPYFKGEMGIV